MTKFYYKDENSTRLYTIDQDQRDFQKYLDFSTFFCSFLDGKFGILIDQLLSNFPEIKNSSLIIGLLKTSKLEQDYSHSLILKIAQHGSKSDLLAFLEASFNDDRRILNEESQKYLYTEFIEDATLNDQEQLSSASRNATTSVLLTAVEAKNEEIVDYLITYCSHLIQKLPLEHQVRISEAALKTNQINILCDLLEFSDFPFPSVNLRFFKIMSDRFKLRNAIEDEDFSTIDHFIDNNLGLKYSYCPDNKSALTCAKELKKTNIFFHLKSKGFQGENVEDVYNNLCRSEKTKAINHAVQQRKKNVKDSIPIKHCAVMLLSAKSSIHNRRIEKKQELQHRKKIIRWFEEIYKVAPELLEVAASCEYLKIIFDFEAVSVENVSLGESSACGSTYPVSKWIFIGAKLSDFKRDQEIKGIIAHELCHYVLCLVYDNQENPYYKYSLDKKEVFDKIVTETNFWSETENNQLDDECFGIISSVYLQYAEKDFHPELIVRPVQIMTQFDNNKKKFNSIQNKFKNLFDFWHKNVIPELKKYIQKNKDVSKDAQDHDQVMLNCLRDVIDDELFISLVNDEEIVINQEQENYNYVKSFEFLYQLRNFILDNDLVSQDEVLSKIQHKQYILISDNAGSGKSWKNGLREILKSKGCKEMSLLQTAMWRSDVIQIHHILWKVYQDMFPVAEDFRNIIKELDEKNRNILNTAAKHASIETFKLLITSIEKFVQPDEMIKLLSNLSIHNQSILHLAARYNESFEVHQSLWNVFRKYFKDKLILDLIKLIDTFDQDGRDVLNTAVKFNTQQLVDFTKKEINRLNHECEQFKL
ncbi:uncharacterized protein [Chironomus tepperi]|uniref:uncharacterized protein n=1 Tax=Chironomus tepperi TaxID=113505 RepID=UPI00391F1D68